MLRSAFMAKMLAASMFLGSAASAGQSSGLKAWLEPTAQGQMVEFQGYVAASEPMLITYRINITRISNGGRATTSQAGKVRITEPNARTGLSLTSINVAKGDSYEAELIAVGPGGETVRVEVTREPE